MGCPLGARLEISSVTIADLRDTRRIVGLLRERHGFKGELRACGYVRRDQVFFLARCGFNALELPEEELATAGEAFETFSAAYQTTNDAGLPLKLTRRS